MARYHSLLAYALQAIGKPLAHLNSKPAGKDAETIIGRLNSAKLQEHFNDAATAALETAGGGRPHERQVQEPNLTDELLRNILGKSASE